MDVTIIICCLNEEDNIGECLESVVNQKYSSGKFEIIVIDGNSKDSTQLIIRAYQEKHENIHLFIEFKRGTASGRNAGVRASAYDYVAFIDADCVAPQNWLEILIDEYCAATKSDKRIVAVGGVNFPPKGSDNFLKALNIAQDSFIGSFNSVQGRKFKEQRYVSSLSNLNVLYLKRAIIEIGNYDESLVSDAEDAELNFRLEKTGWRFLFVPRSFVWHKMRPNAGQWLKNMFRYGRGRARLLKRYPDMWCISYVLPIAFAFAMISILLSVASSFFLAPMAYFPIVTAISIRQCIRKNSIHLTFHVFAVFIIQHLGYAAGEVYGLLSRNVK